MLLINKKIFFVFLISNSLNGVDLNQVVKAFQHFGVLQDKLVFYFKNDPVIEFVSKKVNDLGFCQEIFAFPSAQFVDTDELKEKIESINSFKHPFYRIKISQETESSQIQIKISYDTKYVKKLEVMEFSAISMFKGVAFNIIHDDAQEFFKFDKLPKGKFANAHKPVVVIDMGHGGHDSGAISANGVTEKDITYKVGNKLKRLLIGEDYNVFLTRNSDKFIPLDDRTSGANFVYDKASRIIFVSIHANHSLNKEAKGLETYVPSYSLLNKFDFEKDNLIIQPVCNELMDENNHKLGSVMHENLLNVAKQHNANLVDRKLKKSISQVLLGTEMPTVLIELGFLSNKEEAELLNSAKYQSVLAQGIFQGICKYFDN